MNSFEEAKQEVAKESLDFVFKKLMDKDAGLITKDSLKFALYSYDIPKPSDEKVFDEMLQFLEMPKKLEEQAKKQRTKKAVVESEEDSDEGEESEEEEGVDYDHFKRIFNRYGLDSNTTFLILLNL